jgi:hypothetical protein
VYTTLHAVRTLLLSGCVLLAMLQCGKAANEDEGRKAARIEQPGPEEGVKLGLEQLVAGLNAKDIDLYMSAFSGSAEKLLRESISDANFTSIEGIFFLDGYEIEELMEESGPKTPVGVTYHLRHEFSSGRVQKNRHRGIMAPAEKHSHWVIISITGD